MLDTDRIFQRLYGSALRLLSYRARSRHEVSKYLEGKIRKSNRHIDERLEIAERVLNDLEEEKLIDDKAFTEWWIESSLRTRARSRSFLRHELRQKGVAQDLVDLCLEENTDLEHETIRNFIAKRLIKTFKTMSPQADSASSPAAPPESDEPTPSSSPSPDPILIKKTTNQLLRRGFSYSAIQKAFEEFI